MSTVPGHVIVCGLDHLGLRTIDELRLRDETVVAIGPDDATEEYLAAHDVRLVVGDQRIPRTLRDAGVENASAIVLTGPDDLDNLNTALAATELNPEIHVVIRMFDQELGAHIPELLAGAVALSSSALAAPGFVSAAIDGETGTRFRIAGRVLSSRRSADPPIGHRSIPIARLHPDRTVEMLLVEPVGRSAGRPVRPTPGQRRVALEGLPAATLDQPGTVRLLAVADPGSEVARWSIPVDEVLDAEEEVIVAATRAGLADLLRRARSRAG